MPRRNRQGIVYNIRERGTARLVFDEQRTQFQGVLETTSGETMLVNGKCPTDSNTENQNEHGGCVMNVDVVDGEEGCVFHIIGVNVLEGDSSIVIKSDTLKFESYDRIIGMRAAVEIKQHLTPSLANEAKEVFVGNMEIELLTSHHPTPSFRRESVCAENNDIMILETSDDFLS